MTIFLKIVKLELTSQRRAVFIGHNFQRLTLQLQSCFQVIIRAIPMNFGTNSLTGLQHK